MLRSGFDSQSDGLSVSDVPLEDPSLEEMVSSDEVELLEDCEFDRLGLGFCFAVKTSNPGGGPSSCFLSPSTLIYRREPTQKGAHRAAGFKGSPYSSVKARLPNTLGPTRKVIVEKLKIGAEEIQPSLSKREPQPSRLCLKHLKHNLK